MFLNNKQLNIYKEKINRISRVQCILNSNGVFNIYNLRENDARNIVQKLKQESFVDFVNLVKTSKYNFNHFKFNTGVPTPESYYDIRGMIKEPTNESFDISIFKSLNEKVEKHETLNPKLWTEDNKLKPEVKEKIMQIVKEFTDGLKEDDIEFKLKDVVLVGSNCSYNYNENSDLDIHLVMDTKSLKCPEHLYSALYSAYRSLFEKKFDISFYGIPVEIFIETDDIESMFAKVDEAREVAPLKSNGIYSVMHDKWIKKPVAEEIPELDVNSFTKEFNKWENKYKVIESNPSIKDIKKFIEDLYELRKVSIAQEGEYGTNNLVFKELRNLGYLDNLKLLKNKLKSKELSLEEDYADRQRWIQVIKNHNKFYNFDKYTDQQLFMIAQRLLASDKKQSDVEDEYDEIDWNSLPKVPTCDKCGRRLTTSGECPLCDIGDESVLEEDWIGSDFGKREQYKGWDIVSWELDYSFKGKVQHTDAITIVNREKAQEYNLDIPVKPHDETGKLIEFKSVQEAKDWIDLAEKVGYNFKILFRDELHAFIDR